MPLERFEIDGAYSSIRFSVRHMLISKVRGRFGQWAGTIHIDEEVPGRSSVEVRIDAASIDTGAPERDAHLKSQDFFDAERFRTLLFRSKRVDKLDWQRYRIVGDLRIRNITRELVLDAEYVGRLRDPRGNARTGFTARASIDRGEFGLTFNQTLEAGGLLVGDRVEVDIEVEAVRKVEALQAA
jgi:polyisoprenoid-binding protein YceI